MAVESPWVWIAAALAGWVFLGLVAGRFHAIRGQLTNPPGNDAAGRDANRRPAR